MHPLKTSAVHRFSVMLLRTECKQSTSMIAQKTEITSGPRGSAAIPATLGMNTISARFCVWVSCTLVQALVHGAIRPPTVALRAMVGVMLFVQAARYATNPCTSTGTGETLHAALLQLCSAAVASLRIGAESRCEHTVQCQIDLLHTGLVCCSRLIR